MTIHQNRSKLSDEELIQHALKRATEAEAMADLATSGPWSVTIKNPNYVSNNLVLDENGNVVAELRNEQDTNFVASARWDVPDLCNIVLELVEKLRQKKNEE
jgi:hypothetical protein